MRAAEVAAVPAEPERHFSATGTSSARAPRTRRSGCSACTATHRNRRRRCGCTRSGCRMSARPSARSSKPSAIARLHRRLLVHAAEQHERHADRGAEAARERHEEGLLERVVCASGASRRSVSARRRSGFFSRPKSSTSGECAAHEEHRRLGGVAAGQLQRVERAVRFEAVRATARPSSMREPVREAVLHVELRPDGDARARRRRAPRARPGAENERGSRGCRRTRRGGGCCRATGTGSAGSRGRRAPRARRSPRRPRAGRRVAKSRSTRSRSAWLMARAKRCACRLNVPDGPSGRVPVAFGSANQPACPIWIAGLRAFGVHRRRRSARGRRGLGPHHRSGP